MAKPSMVIIYDDPNAQKVCRAIYAGPEGKVPYQIKVEEQYEDGDGNPGWAPARSHMPVEVVLAHACQSLARGTAKATVVEDVVRYDVRGVKFGHE